jgi:hypothetical protein
VGDWSPRDDLAHATRSRPSATPLSQNAPAGVTRQLADAYLRLRFSTRSGASDFVMGSAEDTSADELRSAEGPPGMSCRIRLRHRDRAAQTSRHGMGRCFW